MNYIYIIYAIDKLSTLTCLTTINYWNDVFIIKSLIINTNNTSIKKQNYICNRHVIQTSYFITYTKVLLDNISFTLALPEFSQKKKIKSNQTQLYNDMVSYFAVLITLTTFYSLNVFQIDEKIKFTVFIDNTKPVL